mmetsp:Transcript_26037/g.61388  ORF Transcript_26037/g.61388 Transcript_26037/m.61388 type:complete len:281 (-) Transcript_26037:29-871(-)
MFPAVSLIAAVALPRAPPLSTSIGTVRVALLIGNDAYAGTERLFNCVNDAHDMRRMLEDQMGFEKVNIKLVTNVNREDFKRAVDWLLHQVQNSGLNGCIAMFFYSGHACEVEGQNFLQPIDAIVKRPTDVEYQNISLNWILKSLNGTSANSTFCLFLDCCRFNENDKTWKSALKGPSNLGLQTLGLDLKSPGGTGDARETSSSFVIGLASDPGTVALCRKGERNSFYTAALLRRLYQPHDLGMLLREVNDDVRQATRNQQRPWVHVALPGGQFVLSNSAP